MTASTAANSDSGLKFLLVLDFEATCGVSIRRKNQEIIEFPTILYSIKEDKVKAVFHEHIRPLRHPILTKFCTDLTGITQEVVDAADPFAVVWRRFKAFLKAQGVFDDPSSHVFLTCGNWDLEKMLPSQIAREAEANPESTEFTIPPPLTHWINIKEAFARHYTRSECGMPWMLAHLGLELEGRHHSGIDDCKNILRIVRKMRADGWRPETEIPTIMAANQPRQR